MSPPRAPVYTNLQHGGHPARVPLGKVAVEVRRALKHLAITHMTNRSKQEWVGMHACVVSLRVCALLPRVRALYAGGGAVAR